MHSFQKTFYTLLKNPQVGLLLVIYLLITATLTRAAFYQYNTPAFYILLFLLFLLTSAFLAGWFGMIKCALSHEKTDDPKKDLENWNETIQTGFLASIPTYILGIMAYIILFCLFSYALYYLTDILIGRPGDVLKQLSNMTANQDAVLNFFATLPREAKILIIKRSTFLYCGYLAYLFLTLYSIPALYFNQTANPLTGLKNGVLALVKKPFFSLCLFVSIVICHIALIFAEAISTINPLLMFLAFILRMSFIIYVVVLIFSVYEENFKNNCNNRPDCIG